MKSSLKNFPQGWISGHQMLVVFLFACALLCQIAPAQESTDTMKKAIREASVIVTAQVDELKSAWVDDERGKHIYTTVGFHLLASLKGEVTASEFALIVIGGKVDDITELVFPSYSFVKGEKCMLLLREGGRSLLGGQRGKMSFLRDNVLFNNAVVPASAFTSAVRTLVENPDSPASFREVLQLETEQNLSLSRRMQQQTGVSAANPMILSVNPPKAPAGTRTLVTISGSNFLTTQGSGSVVFFQSSGSSGLSAEVTVWSDTQIVCTVPGNMYQSACSGPLVVTNANGLASAPFSFPITFGYRQVKWSGSTPVIPYYVNPNFRDSTGLIAAVRAAGETWNNSGSAIRLSYSGVHTGTTASWNFRNEIFWGKPEAFEEPFGMATVWARGSTIIEADMALDSTSAWSTASVPGSQKLDVQSVALHEFGHYLMLADLYGDLGDGINDEGKVLCGGFGAGRTRRSLHADDIEGIRWIYGLPGSQVPAPAISPSTGTFPPSIPVTISCSSPDVTIRYTIDGSEPTATSPVYFAPLTISGGTSVTLKAKGYKDAWVASPTTTAQFVCLTPPHKPIFVTKLRDTTIAQNQVLTFVYRSTDSNNDTLTYSLVNPPAGASLYGSGAFLWTPSPRQSGVFPITVVVSDGIWSDTSRCFVTVTKVNVEPVMTSRAPSTLTQVMLNRTILFAVSASDPNGDQLAFTWHVNGNSEKTGTDTSFTRIFSGTVGSAQNVTCVFSDPGGLRDSTEWNFTLAKDTLQVPPETWAFRGNTGMSSSILLVNGYDYRIENQRLRSGDAMGVFFRRNDTLICAGHIVWQIQSAVITVWGDDDQTAVKDGFAEGEPMNFKIWDSRRGKEFDADFSMMTGEKVYNTNQSTQAIWVIALTTPPMPTNVTPGNGVVNVPVRPTLSWTKTPRATTYRLQLSLDPAFSSVVVDDSTLTDTSRVVGPLQYSTGYLWRVSAKNEFGASPWGATWVFTTSPAAPTAPTLAAPADSARNLQLTTTMSWNAVSGASAYHLQVSTAASFSSFVVNDSILTTTSKSVGPLLLNTAYFWRVRAKNGGGWGPYSSTRSFSTIRTTSVEVAERGIPSQFGLSQNYPNPFNPSTTLRFGIPKSGFVSLKVFDMLGRDVETLVAEELSPGYYQAVWKANVPSGVYFYRIQAGEFSQTKRLILLK